MQAGLNFNHYYRAEYVVWLCKQYKTTVVHSIVYGDSYTSTVNLRISLVRASDKSIFMLSNLTAIQSYFYPVSKTSNF